MKVRFLYLGGCPNAEPALVLLKDILASETPGTVLECLEIKSEEESDRHGFLGSPTIQINGLDVEKRRKNDPPYYGCRIYESEEGLSGVPPKTMIIEAIREILAEGDGSRPNKTYRRRTLG